MISYWTSFARTGVPKAPGEPDWPTYAPNKSYMDFVETPEPSTNLMPGMFELQEEDRRARKAGRQSALGRRRRPGGTRIYAHSALTLIP